MMVVVPWINLPLITDGSVLLNALMHVSEPTNWRECVFHNYVGCIESNAPFLFLSLSLFLLSIYLLPPPSSNKASNVTFWVMYIFEVPVIYM